MKKLASIKLFCELGLAVIVLTCIIFNLFNVDSFDQSGVIQFRYFTVLSNIFLGIVCLILAFKPQNKLNKTKSILLFSSVLSTTITFFVAIFFLSFIYSLPLMIAGPNFFLHLLNPILGLFIYFSYQKDLKYLSNLLAMIPFILYGVIYLILVVGTKTWTDFYCFNQGGYWYISLVVMIVFGFGLANLLYFINKKIYKSGE